MSRRRVAALVILVAASSVWVWWWRSPGPTTEPAAREERSSRAGGARESLCDHPYVPTIPGTELEYRWVSPSREGDVVLRLVRSRRSARGATFTWAMEAPEQGGASATIERACDDRGAEEPWVLLTAMGGTLARQSWRVPRGLALGRRYEGSIDVTFAGFTVPLRRAHRVVGEEDIEVTGGSFAATKLEVEDSSEASATPVTSAVWIAPRVGLVRWELGSGRTSSSFELAAVRVPP